MNNPVYDPNGRIRFDGVETRRCPLNSQPDEHFLKYYCLSGLPARKNQRIAKTHIEFVKMDARKQNVIRIIGNKPPLAVHLYFSKNQCYLIKEDEVK